VIIHNNKTLILFLHKWQSNLIRKGYKLSDQTLNILMLGDIIGNPGLEQMVLKLSSLKKKENIHFCIANGENSDEGFGITESIISKYKENGIDVITSGNHIWSNKNTDKLLENYDYLIRPANYPQAPGKGWCTLEYNHIQIGFVNLLGRYQMTPIDCPFQTLSKLLRTELKKASIIIVDFHAENSAEKQALAYYFDGKISLLAGTHTHVQSADEKILPKGTGYITDLGICGGLDSVIGMTKDTVITKILNQIVIPYTPSQENKKLQGIIANISLSNFETTHIKRFCI
jgi:2',3'-cyclic-nucleotide 2'-phosphodiesterase